MLKDFMTDLHLCVWKQANKSSAVWKAKHCFRVAKFKYSDLCPGGDAVKKNGLKKSFFSYLKREIHHCDKLADTIYIPLRPGVAICRYSSKGAVTYIPMLWSNT